MSSTDTEEVNIFFFGSKGIGKKHVINKFIYGTYEESKDILEVYQKMIISEGKKYILNITNYDYKPKDKSMQLQYFKTCDIAVLAFSAIDTKSFELIPSLIDDYFTIKDDNYDLPCIVIALKADLERKVSQKQGQDLAQKYKNCKYMEISIKNNDNLEDLFFSIAKMYLNYLKKEKERIERLIIKQKVGSLFGSLSNTQDAIDDLVLFNAFNQ